MTRALLAGGCLLACVLALVAGCGGGDLHQASPRLVRSYVLTEGDAVLQPLRLQVVGDTLFVSCRGLPRLDLYTLDLERIGSVDLTRPEPVTPSAFAVSDSQIVVCDHTKGAIVIYDRRGHFVDSFGLLPDDKTRLAPLAMARFKDVVYVADMGLKQVLAVSVAGGSGVVDRGELILQVPGEKGGVLGLPSAVFVTPDGRLLVGDAAEGRIRAFTCDGQEIYAFPPVPGYPKIAPLGFALDDVTDPALLAAESFDPSGVREMGRIHVADGRGGVVHMFNPLGEHIGSYPHGERLDGPSDVAISLQARRIFVADSRGRRIHVFSYGDDS
jgi:sugar lactone lactonase YvrE